MSLYVYMILHGNLSFSSIPKNHYSKVLDVCYWPILEMINEGYRIGIEFPAETLLEIEKIDSSFIKELKKLWQKEKCDFIASGYSQAVFPLIPYDVNVKNLKFGKEIYSSLLGKIPKIAFLNEMTCSNSLPLLYANEGFEYIIMDWDNASEFQNYQKELRYLTAELSFYGKSIGVLWNSSLNSFKFQRCIYNRIPVDEYIKGILGVLEENKERALILYGTDWEMFNYRPLTGEIMTGEIEKMKYILNELKNYEKIKLVRPSEIIQYVGKMKIEGIGTAECPIPCKNRDDYNVVRWAVSGRDDVQINTQCYRMFNCLKDIENFIDNKNDVNVKKLWMNLCHLWGSDFRTKTTNEKHYYFRNNMGDALHKVYDLKEKLLRKKISSEKDADLVVWNTTGNDVVNEAVEIVLQFKKGMFYKYIGLKDSKKELLSQCEEITYYRDGSIRTAKIIFLITLKSGKKSLLKVFEKEKQISSESFIRIDRDFINVETPSVKLSLCSSTGADIRKLIFNKISKEPLIKYLPPVYYDHIGHSNDYYSGWVQYCTGEGRIFNDTIKVKQKFNGVSFPIRVPVMFEMDLPFGKCSKTVYVYVNEPRVDISYNFNFFDLNPVYIRAAITTINPEAFDKNNLKYSSVNGTDKVESYYLKGKKIKQNNPVIPFSSATTCVSATEGWIDISDDKKGISILTDKSLLYNVPMIEYEEINSKFLLRIYNSLSETDETGKVLWRGYDKVYFVYYGHNNNISDIRKKAAVLNRKLSVLGMRNCRVI